MKKISVQATRIFIPLISLTPLLSSLSSCSTGVSSSPPAPAMAYRAESKNSSSKRILLKSGDMHLESTEVATTAKKAQLIVSENGGRTETVSIDEDERAYASLDLRVPSEKLPQTMDQLATLGKVTSSNIESEDITEQWIDLQAKLKNMRAHRDRLRALLQNAKTVKETLEVEKELARVQGELDSLQARINAMSKHSTLSKLSLRIHEKTIPGPLGVVTKVTWWTVKKLFVLN